MERQRDAQAVASGCFQASLSDPLLGQPGNQLAPAVGRIGETPGSRLRAGQEAGVECVLGNIDAQDSVSHSQGLPGSSRRVLTATAPHRSTLYTGSTPQRVPGYLNSGAWKSGAGSTARVVRQRDDAGSPLSSPSGGYDLPPDTAQRTRRRSYGG